MTIYNINQLICYEMIIMKRVFDKGSFIKKFSKLPLDPDGWKEQ